MMYLPAFQNANAYLLFYKRRSNEPLGGKTHYKIEEARLSAEEVVDPTPSADTQLPTPPNEIVAPTFVSSQKPQNTGWRTPASRNRSTPSSSPPPLDELPNFEESQHDQLLPGTGLNSLLMDDGQSFRFPSSFKPSPTSSNEVEADDEDAVDPDLRGLQASPIQLMEEEWHLSSTSPSPIESDNPFSDVNSQKNEVVDNDEIPRP